MTKARARLPAPRYRNKTEAAYADRLELLKRGGKILDWRYEETKFRLGDGCWYLPDFQVIDLDGFVEYHEVKGFLRESGRTKFLAVADKFTEYTWIMVRKTKAGWAEIYRIGEENK